MYFCVVLNAKRDKVFRDVVAAGSARLDVVPDSAVRDSAGGTRLALIGV